MSNVFIYNETIASMKKNSRANMIFFKSLLLLLPPLPSRYAPNTASATETVGTETGAPVIGQ